MRDQLMIEHLSPLTIELLTGRRLAPQDLLPATRHLSGCAECRQRVTEAAEVANRVRPLTAELQSATAEPSHLPYEQLEAYVDESLDLGSREEVKRHLAVCAECQGEAVELKALRDNLSTYPLVSTAAVLPVTRQQSFWERLAGSLNLRPAQLALVTATLVVLIAVLAVLIISRRPAVPIVNKNSAPQNPKRANQNSQPPAQIRMDLTTIVLHLREARHSGRCGFAGVIDRHRHTADEYACVTKGSNRTEE